MRCDEVKNSKEKDSVFSHESEPEVSEHSPSSHCDSREGLQEIYSKGIITSIEDSNEVSISVKSFAHPIFEALRKIDGLSESQLK
jgi:hypothetical protein